MKKILRWFPMFMVLLGLVSCGSGNQAAEKELAAADAAYAPIAEQANGLAPVKAQEIEAALAAARASLANGDAKGATTAAQDLQSRIRALADELPALSQKLTADWTALTAAVPSALAATQKKLDDFGRPPEGMPARARFDAAAAQLAQLRTQWAEAESHAGSGRLAQAIAAGEQVRYDAVKLLTEFQAGS